MQNNNISLWMRGIQASFDYAIQKGAPIFVLQGLIKQGANPNALNNSSKALIHIAAENCDIALLTRLALVGADPNLLNGAGQSALHIAILSSNKFVQIFKFVDQMLKLPVNLKQQHEGMDILDTIMHKFLLLKLPLLRHIFYTDSTSTQEHKEKLVATIAHCLPRLVEKLIKHDPEILTNIRSNRNVPYVNALTSLVAVPIDRNVRPTMAKILKDLHKTLVLMLLDNGAELDFQTQNADGWINDAALHAAVRFQGSDLAIAHLLLDRGANPNLIVQWPFLEDFGKTTALSLALQTMRSEGKATWEERFIEWDNLIDKLIAKGADINLAHNTQSPLQLAMEIDQRLVEKFLAHGADIQYSSSIYSNVFSDAIERRNFKVVKKCLQQDPLVVTTDLNFGIFRLKSRARTTIFSNEAEKLSKIFIAWLQEEVASGLLDFIGKGPFKKLNADTVNLILRFIYEIKTPEVQNENSAKPDNVFLPIMQRVRDNSTGHGLLLANASSSSTEEVTEEQTATQQQAALTNSLT